VWNDSVPTTRAACEDTEGRAIFYKKSGSQWLPLTGEQRAVGRWLTGSAPMCAVPFLLHGPIEAGASYRIVGSMRRISGGNPTRKVQTATVFHDTRLAAGGNTCALLFNGTRVRCWGPGDVGRLGYGNTNNIGDNERPSAAGDVDIGAPVFQVAVGSQHSCAVLKNGSLRCWGRGTSGALGYANTNHIGDNETPAAAGDVDVGGKVAQLAAGWEHNCAIMDTGNVRCWGKNGFGQLGQQTTNTIGDNETPESVRVFPGFPGSTNADIYTEGNPSQGAATQIVAGGEHTCILHATGQVRCWGRGNFGQLGYASTNNVGINESPGHKNPVNVLAAGERVIQLAAGNEHTCALINQPANPQAGNKVRCWGRNNVGQLGYGNTNNIGDNEHPIAAGNVTTAVHPGPVAIAAGGDNTCVLGPIGELVCWGREGARSYSNLNHIGDNEIAGAGGATIGAFVKQVVMGSSHVCVVLSNNGGAVKCWGLNPNGTLGLSTTVASKGGVPGERPLDLPNVELWGGCTDGTSEQSFLGDHAVGCAGSVTFANRQTLCAPGWSVCSANQWVVQRASGAPTHNYWTNDNLGFFGSSSNNCSATTAGNSCGDNPMRICAGNLDPEGNRCNWAGCGLEGLTPNQFMGGCLDNTTAGSLCCQDLSTVDGCADGSAEQIFPGGAVGCAGSVAFASRNSLCATGWKACTATEWVTRRDGIAPTHSYWTNDPLKFAGTDTTNCWASTTQGSGCGETPMRVCAAGPSNCDPEGNCCNWTNCGLNSATPNDYFGGCAGNTTAGTLCCPL
jgi:hypothetical protein